MPGPVERHAIPPQHERFEPWRSTEPVRRRPGRRTLIVCAAGAAAIAVVATSVVVLLNRGGDAEPAVDVRAAGRQFAADPSVNNDGRDQELSAVTALGDTAVVVGGDADHTGYRAQFFVSTNGGRSFGPASVRTGADAEPVLGEIPRHVAASPQGWLSIGDRPGGTVIWTSRNGQAWTRQPDVATATFGPNDRVSRLVGTGDGFLAVGATSAKGDFSDAAPVLWRSRDGQSWQRFTTQQLRLGTRSGTLWLSNVVAAGQTVLIQGVHTQKGKPPRNLVWRSADGRSWRETEIPSPRGTVGLTIGANGSGFVALREIKLRPHAAVFTSADGGRWTKTGEIKATGYQRIWRLSGSQQGLIAAVSTNGRLRLASSRDGSSWQVAGEVSAAGGRSLLDAAVTAAGTIIVGREQDQDIDAILEVRDPQGQEVAAQLPAARPDAVVQSVGASGSRAVAVGSTNGDAAAWTSADGGRWTRSDTKALARSGKQRLMDVTAGGSGWLAVGIDAGAPWRPIVATSADGATWQTADDAKVFRSNGRAALVPYAAASGPGGYVIVGEDDLAPATWFSADLKTWVRGAPAGSGDLSGRPGANRWMRGVVSGSFGYVAVGGQRDPSIVNAPAVRPAVWTSADGRKWANQQLPVPAETNEGWISSIAVKGDLLVAAGSAAGKSGLTAFAFQSTDGGRSWQEVKVPEPEGSAPTTVTKVAATAQGFVMTGANGDPANGDVVLWTSTDGKAWTLDKNLPKGLSGQGDQTLTGLATVGGDLLAVGTIAGPQGQEPVLWQRPAP